MEQKFSSLHDDVLHPLSKSLEYDPKKGYPNKYTDRGERGENTIIMRLKQFGILEKDMQRLGVDNWLDINEGVYEKLMLEVLKKQYQTLFASVYGRWTEMGLDQQRDLIEKASRAYKHWGVSLIAGEGDSAPSLVTALEGADVIREIGDVDWLYKQGIRSVMPQYGKPNALAGSDGLTDLGKQVVRELFMRQVNVDLAHSNPNTRGGIIQIARDLDSGKLLSYSHGARCSDIAKDNYFGFMSGERGLSDSEIKDVLEMGGIIGLGVSRPFFGSIDHLIETIDSVCQRKNGPQSLGLGTDFGGVSPALMVDGIRSVEDLNKIGEILAIRFGYPDSQIQAILKDNVTNWAKKLQK